MPQLNVLPVDVTQSVDLKSENTSRDSQNSLDNKHFSSLIEQHIKTENSSNTDKNKKDQSGNVANNSVANKENTTPAAEKNKISSKNEKAVEDNLSEHVTSKQASSADTSSEDTSLEHSSSEKQSADSKEKKENNITEKSLLNEVKLNDDSSLEVTDDTLNDLEQSQKFISLLHSANKILQNEKAGATNKEHGVIENCTDECLAEEVLKGTKLAGNERSDKAEIKADRAQAQQKPTNELQNTNSDNVLDDKVSNTHTNSESAEEASQTVKQENTKNNSLPFISTDNQNKQAVGGTSTKFTSPENSELSAVKTQLEGKEAEVNYSQLQQASESKNEVLKSNVNGLSEAEKQKNLDLNKNKFSENSTQASDNKTSSSVSASDQVASKTLLEGMIKDKRNSIEIQSLIGSQTSAGVITSDELNSSSIKSLTNNKQFELFETAASANKNTQQVDTHSRSGNFKQNNPQSLEQQMISDSVDTAQLNENEFSLDNLEGEMAEQTLSPNKKLEKTANPHSYVDITSQATYATKVAESLASNSINANELENITNAVIAESNIQTKHDTQFLSESISLYKKDFAQAVKDKVMVIISQKLQQFDMRLDPPELGNVQVRVNMQNEQAVVNFLVQNQQVKEVFDQSLDKLKTMLSQSGVDVGEANVQQQAQQSNDDNQHKQSEGYMTDGYSSDDVFENTSTVLSGKLFETSATSIDYYA